MTQEVTQVVSELKALKKIIEKKEHLIEEHKKTQAQLKEDYEKKISNHKKTAPVAPSKRAIRPLTPSVTGKGVCFSIALIVSIVLIVLSIFTQVKHQSIKSIKATPGNEYNQWCETLISNSYFDTMTEADWAPVKESWEKQGVTVTWNDLVELNESGGFNLYGTTESIKSKILDNLFETEVDSLTTKFTAYVMIGIVGIILVIVLRSGFMDMLDTLDHLWDIPKFKKQNKASRHYNAVEYPKLVAIYEEKALKHKEKGMDLENTQKAEKKALEEAHEIKLKEVEAEEIKLRKASSCNNSASDIGFLIYNLENGSAATIEDAYSLLREKRHQDYLARAREEERRIEESNYYSKLSSGLNNFLHDNDDSYEKEQKRHNAEMERMERERARKEQERAWAEERERRDAKQKQRMDEYRQREQARLKCRGCVNLGKCNTSAMQNSLSCGGYRPK